MSGKQPKQNSRAGIDEYGRTPLINAVSEGNIELAKDLISKGAELDIQDDNGWCALHFAAQNKEDEISIALLEGGADPDLTDSHGNGPLWTATMNAKGDFSIVRVLIEHGAKKENKNKHGRSPLDMAFTFKGGIEREFEQGA
tara:strand:+ start:150 stop:575 length:426 start_codon:yes stop_codon:yes gene_type:complete